MAKCDAVGCKKDATQGVHLRFYAKGVPRDTHQPAFSANPVVRVCDDHVQYAKDSEWYGPKQRAMIRAGMRGYAEPDFDTADVFFKPLAGEKP